MRRGFTEEEISNFNISEEEKNLLRRIKNTPWYKPVDVSDIDFSKPEYSRFTAREDGLLLFEIPK